MGGGTTDLVGSGTATVAIAIGFDGAGEDIVEVVGRGGGGGAGGLGESAVYSRGWNVSAQFQGHLQRGDRVGGGKGN